ncbi:ROK family protein [Anaerococcus sp. NML200537]|uniref:ROK family protein n=1 Tax=Anaerococcus sp. NML200537 TaxID=2954485 RepID=UPI002237521D|nr:ROK family protein [Anaerococcus sp. NML200537]MCW6702530.1 ROK family protein [Anaerococcus sp. NML200537]
MYLVFDVGGTYSKYALMDYKAEIKERGKFDTVRTNREDFVKSLENIVEKYKDQISGIGLSMPGFIDSEKGFMVNGGSLAYIKNWPIVDELSKRFGKVVTVENDARCAALAEYWQGNLKAYKNSVTLVLGTGIGGAIMIDGKIYRGSDLVAGELSFILTNIMAERKMENSMCAIASVPQMVGKVVERLNLSKENANGEYVFSLAENGDEIALEEIRAYLSIIAFLIYNLNLVLNPEIFAIGGGISRQELTHTILKEELEKIYDSMGLDLRVPKVINCKFFNDANLIGALYKHIKN